jgi:hypothetical protein
LMPILSMALSTKSGHSTTPRLSWTGLWNKAVIIYFHKEAACAMRGWPFLFSKNQLLNTDY